MLANDGIQRKIDKEIGMINMYFGITEHKKSTKSMPGNRSIMCLTCSIIKKNNDLLMSDNKDNHKTKAQRSRDECHKQTNPYIIPVSRSRTKKA